MKKYKSDFNIEQIGRFRFYSGIVVGIGYSIILTFLFQMLSKTNNVTIALNDGNWNNLINSKLDFYYTSFFGFLSVSLGFCFTTYLWLSKIEHIKSLSLPNDHLNLISELEIELKKFGYDKLHLSEGFLKMAEKLFNEVPSEDISQMFFQLEDYNYQNSYDIESGFYSFESLNLTLLKNRQTKSIQSKSSSCNCRWLCSNLEIYDYHNDCEETSHGCGLFWLWSCTDKAY
ncbi:bacteriocin fulvocin C-related protein [Flavobacteriaceae bacterium]|nr:bacteriocin fulvocin C-related protein [Flavobacteriaceae bacterium]